MSELPPTEALPAPPPSAPRGRSLWSKVLAGVVAVAVGLGGAAVASDAASDDGEETVTPGGTARPVPVLAAGPLGSALSSAVALYGVNAWSSDTQGLVLGAWGAAFADLLDDDDDPAPEPPDGAVFVDDPRLTDPAGGPGFTDPCAEPEPPSGCPGEDDSVPAEILGGVSQGANSATVVAFPHPDVELAGECAFADVEDDELPIAVITANPGEIELRFGDELVTVNSDAGEVTEWDAWQAAPEGDRPPETFVAHCIAVPRPASTSPIEIIAVAVDDIGQVAVAETIIAPSGDDVPPTVTPIDDTMVRVDLPLKAGATATVQAVPVSSFAGATPVCGAGSPVVNGWREGTTEPEPVTPPDGARPYLEGITTIQRTTVALPEGEPSLVCITQTIASIVETTAMLATPPDARRLQLAVTELDLGTATTEGQVKVLGTFEEVDWTPCAASMPASPAGTSTPGPDGAMCSSGGDTGAIAAAGGLLDVAVRVGGDATHLVRIPLFAAPGGAITEAYRIPIPAPDFGGVLCTPGVEVEGCVAPEGGAVLGTLVLTATWDEGPVGPSATEWTIAPAPAA